MKADGTIKAGATRAGEIKGIGVTTTLAEDISRDTAAGLCVAGIMVGTAPVRTVCGPKTIMPNCVFLFLSELRV